MTIAIKSIAWKREMNEKTKYIFHSCNARTQEIEEGGPLKV